MIGTGVGALASGLPKLGSVIVQGISARGQRKHDIEQAKVKREADAAEAEVQREHDDSVRRREIAVQMLQQRRALISRWREQLRYARDVYDVWLQGEKASNISYDPPNVVGDEWFEELRPHLSAESPYRMAIQVSCDISVVTALSIEIGRIEREWIAEAQS